MEKHSLLFYASNASSKKLTNELKHVYGELQYAIKKHEEPGGDYSV